MNLRIVCFALAAGIGLPITFCLRHRTLSELRAGNDALRQRVEAQDEAPAPAPITEPQTSNTVASLSRQEHLELLELRGQIATLRRELRDASNRVANASETTPPRTPITASPIPAEQQSQVQEMLALERSPATLAASRFAVALGKYLAQSGGQLPNDLAQVEPFGDFTLPRGVSQRFELVRSGVVPDDERSYTLVAHEREPSQTPDGRWRRICVFADGNIVTLTTSGQAPNQAPDWQAVEGRTETRAKQRAQQRQGAVPR